jgi:hypothetical protein
MWKWLGYTYENKNAITITKIEQTSSQNNIKPDGYKSINSSSIRFPSEKPINAEIYEKSRR